MFPGFGGPREKPVNQYKAWKDFKKKAFIFVVSCGALFLTGKYLGNPGLEKVQLPAAVVA
jgi:hypothetical protein